MNLLDIQPNIVTADPEDKVWMFYGESGTRKTSVAASFDKHLILAFDVGYKLIPNAYAVPILNWRLFKEAINDLKKQQCKDRYKIIVIDTIGLAYRACYTYIMLKLGIEKPSDVGFGAAWTMLKDEFNTTIRSIGQMGYGVVLIGHSQEKEIYDKEGNIVDIEIRVEIDKAAKQTAITLADFAFYLRKEEKENEEPTVFAYSNLVKADTKRRARYFTDKFEFTYDNLQKELSNAIDRQYEALGEAVPEKPSIEVKDIAAWEEIIKEVQEIAFSLLDKNLYEKEISESLANKFNGAALSSLPDTELNREKLLIFKQELETLV